jgi:uncharacterized membrane protein YoaK (UPF0700 family)
VGVIGTSTTDIHGNEIHTEVITNNLDELMIRVAKHFGHKRHVPFQQVVDNWRLF